MSDPENGDIVENPEPEADTEGNVETDDPEGQYGVNSVINEEGAEHILETERDIGSGDNGACGGSSSSASAKTNIDKDEIDNHVAEEPEGNWFGATAQGLNCDCPEADSELASERIAEENARTSSVSENQTELTEDDIEADLVQRKTNQDLMDKAYCVPESEKDLQSAVVVDSNIPNVIKTEGQDQNLSVEPEPFMSGDFTNNSVHDNKGVSFKTHEDVSVRKLTDSLLCSPPDGASNVDLLGLPENGGLRNSSEITRTVDLPEDTGLRDLSEDAGVKDVSEDAGPDDLPEDAGPGDLPEDAGPGDLPEDDGILLTSNDIQIGNCSANNSKDRDTMASASVVEAVSLHTGDHATSSLSVDDIKVPEDEIGSVCVVLSNHKLNVLSPAESVESYEPECDQETDCAMEVNTSSNSVGDVEILGKLSSKLPEESNSGTQVESTCKKTQMESNSGILMECNSEAPVESSSDNLVATKSETPMESKSGISISSNSGTSMESSSVTSSYVKLSGNCDNDMPNKRSGSNNYQGQSCNGFDDKVLTQVVKSTNGSSVEVNSSQMKEKDLQNCDNKQENIDVLSPESVSVDRSNLKCEPSEHQNGLFQSSNNSLTSTTCMSDSKISEVNLKSVKDQESNRLDDDLLSELESELGPSSEAVTFNFSSGSENSLQFDNLRTINGVAVDAKIIQQCKELQDQLKKMKEQLQQQEADNQRLKSDKEDTTCLLQKTIQERDSYLQEINIMKTRNQEDFYLPQIKELEYTIAQQQNEIRALKEKLSSHDTAAKRAISTLQGELKIRIDQVTKMYDDANKEKDAMVVKYAQAEKKSLESQKMIERLESKVRDGIKEKETFTERLRDMKVERKKLQADLDTKAAEVHSLSKEVEKQREMLSSSDVRIKWAQNKLKTELESHKETKTTLEKTCQKLKEAKEETEQIRRDCQAMIKTYQESEEMKSINLDQELKVKESQLKLHEQEKSDQEEVFSKTVQELEQLKIKHRETLSELETYKDKSQCLESEQQHNEETINRYKDIMQKQKKDNRELQEKIEKLIQFQSDFKRAQNTIKSLDAEITELKISNKDLVIDMEACRKRESEKLELTEKLSAKNAELQSENTNLSNKVLTYSGDLQNLRMKLQELETKQEDAIQTLTEEKRNLQQEIETLSSKLEEKSKAVEELTIRIEDQKDEMKTLKRKHGNNIKDLTRELQQTRRKLESYESNGDKDRNSMGSRTSSNGSLNTVGISEGTNSHATPSVSIHNHNHVNARQTTPPEQVVQEYPVITEQVEPDKQLLIERIVKLQRALARKNEKIEFVNDHISQLVDEVQKKNKIIQNYALREEAGILTPEVMDINKAQLSRKHSIMSSVYSSHSTDGSMTLDLSLEINKKLQAVLEDTLLKNITLKESLDTLGQEIARLSQENRNLQLHLQDKKQKR